MKPGSFLIPVILCSIVIFSCSKSSSSVKPQFTLTSIDKNPVPINDSLVVHFKFTTGSVSNGYFVSVRTRLNQRPPQNVAGSDTLVNPVPDLEGASKGEFRYALPSDYLQTGSGQNDTIIMQYFVLTSSGKSSDTISSPKIIALYQ